MAKRMLADVLWEAANVHLWDGILGGYGLTASCCAVYYAEKGREWGGRHNTWGDAVEASTGIRFLRLLGCDVGNTQFNDVPTWPKRQGDRYLWLLLAVKVAEDEGIEV